jgi:hypothetical protein
MIATGKTLKHFTVYWNNERVGEFDTEELCSFLQKNLDRSHEIYAGRDRISVDLRLRKIVPYVPKSLS